MKDYIGRIEVQLHLFVSSAPDKNECSASRLLHMTHGGGKKRRKMAVWAPKAGHGDLQNWKK